MGVSAAFCSRKKKKEKVKKKEKIEKKIFSFLWMGDWREYAYVLCSFLD